MEIHVQKIFDICVNIFVAVFFLFDKDLLAHFAAGSRSAPPPPDLLLTHNINGSILFRGNVIT